ncbi:MAG: hypothetical protein GF344_02595, partial [Chitinivibrionales bacterium]|nr:hypothetical protein [Chitinivibrionales bacterium]
MRTHSTLTRGRTISESADIAELDITPIMNMFIILIPFLVSMAVFTHLAILKFSLPPNVGTGLDDSQGKPKVKLTVVVAPRYLAITHGDTMLDSLALSDNDYDYEAFGRSLERHRNT